MPRIEAVVRRRLARGCPSAIGLVLIRLVLLIAILFTSRALADSPVAVSDSTVDNPAAKKDGEVRFERDVMAVLSKAGCNAGTCHGNVNGKGGFFLSLRGQDADFDHQQIVHAAKGRRVNLLEPKQSLVLLKATNQLAHEGGKRFDIDSPEFAILSRWLATGASRPTTATRTVTGLTVTPQDQVLWYPSHQQQLTVVADFSDGTSCDVSRMAVYESSDPLVRISADGLVNFDTPGSVTIVVRYLDAQVPARVACRHPVKDFAWPSVASASFIDELIFERLQQLQITPALPASEHVFVRRVYLDLLGVLPSEEEARTFVADTNPHKRQQLVDQLLERPEFAVHWALKWSDLLRNEEKTLDAKGVELLHNWIRQQFADDRPLNEFAHELLSARGSTYEHPPANYWRAHRDPYTRAETTAQVFLGVRLQCARCHNHPFDHWTQDEYYEWSSLFEGIDYEIVKNERRDDLDKHEFVGEQIVQVKGDINVNNPRTGQPAAPKLLGSDDAIDGDRLNQLAAWTTSPSNQLFAQSQVNRIWYHLMGRGLVEPIDDLRLTNPASHPQLLQLLADELVRSGFSLKHMVRLIATSNVYQLSSALGEGQFGPDEQYDERLFARAVVRRLTAEQLLDCQSQILGVAANFEGYATGTRAGELAGVERVRRKLSADDLFLRRFGKPERLLACECERSDQPTLGQALTLVGSENLHRRLEDDGNRIGQLLKSGVEPTAMIESLYWTALSRPPTDEELAGVNKLVDETGDLRLVLEDLTWALLNAKELVFRN